MSTLVFQQLFENTTSTYSYLLADPVTRDAVLIDPVLETVGRDLQLIAELDVKLRYILETHIHADHVTGAARLADETGAKIGLSRMAGAEGAQILLEDGMTLSFGSQHLTALATPGHTESCMCFVVADRVFTGDTLLIRGNGRTDFQQGSAERLYRSVHEKLFTLADATLVYPGHDYKGFTSSTIGAEKCFNARLGANRSLESFARIMAELKLDQPKKIDQAVPANLKCGRVL